MNKKLLEKTKSLRALFYLRSNMSMKVNTFPTSSFHCVSKRTVASLAIIVELAEGNIDGVTFDIEIFRDDGRAMACIVFIEEIGDMETAPIYNFTGDNIIFKNINKLD